MKNNAATYSRSSKDRNDVSPAAQERKLADLAVQRGLKIIDKFSDVEMPGSSEHRPDFIRMLAAIKNPNRGWSHLLVYDTSRLARGRYIAQALHHQAKRRGVTVHYATIPADIDPISEVVLQSSFQAMDEVWSLMCRTKGLMGMRENVARGFRAGGRAPFGYRLEHIPTGVVRDGKPVTKSKLVLGDDARKARAYFQGRARGISRARLLKDLTLGLNSSTLVGLEWNALTYAGHTVWNVNAEAGSGRKRRPREEWVITRSTHEALISDAEAESILAALENSTIGQAVSRAKASVSGYLLTGYLIAPDGRPWTGRDGRYYKLKSGPEAAGKLIPCEAVDRAVLARLTADLRSEKFLTELLDASRAAGLITDPQKPIREQIARLEREKARAASLALTTDDGGTFAKLVEERSSQIAALRAELTAVEADVALTDAVRGLTPGRLRELLMELGGPAEALQSMVERITLDPSSMSCQVHYRAGLGLSVASPRRADRWAPTLAVDVCIPAA